jgi:ketosteroid isomerase-like protein
VRQIICLSAALAVCALAACAQPADPTKEILALERAAMDGMQKGDSGPMLKVLAPDVTYFHAVVGQRLEGAAAVKALVDSYGGRPLYDKYEIRTPKVQAAGDAAVLTYDFVTYNGSMERRWNVTQVYKRGADGWRVIHSHFSANQPPAAGGAQ